MSYTQQISVSSTGYGNNSFDVGNFARALGSAQRENRIPPQQLPVRPQDEASPARPPAGLHHAEQRIQAENGQSIRESFVSMGGAHHGHHSRLDGHSAGREAIPVLLSARHYAPGDQPAFRMIDTAAAPLVAHASMPVGTLSNLSGQQTPNANGTEFWQFFQIISMGYAQIARRESFYTDMIKWKRRASPQLVKPVIDPEDGDIDIVQDVLDSRRDSYRDAAA
jgi:hypothetical protein